MFRKDFYRIFLLTVLCLAGATFAAAQTAPITGKVVLKKADNTTVPVEGALVEVFRIDVKATLPSDKTNKKGEFGFAGLPLGARFVLSVSAPGAKPGYLPNVKAGDEKLLITLTEGDGKRWTEQEIRDAIASATTGDNQQAQPTEEQKKAQAEYEKKVAEVTAKNKEIESKNTVIQNALKEGNDAFNAKNYDLAISKWTEGINADPTYVGSAPILLNNKGTALKIVGVDSYNRAVKSTDAAEKADLLAKAKASLEGAVDAFANSWNVIKNAPAADIAGQTNLEPTKYAALSGLTDAYRLVVATKLNPAKAADAKDAFDAYTAIETDPAKKAKAQLTYADIMREMGDSEKAIAGYRAVLQTSPDNSDAMAGLGLSLFNAGVVASNKEQMQEGLNYMTKYIETSPISATDSASVKEFKQSVKDAVDYLKNTEKLAPQKVTTPGKRKG
jgi:tetratricopeptide (TPR) repeat protein